MRGLYSSRTPDVDDAVSFIAIILLLTGLVWLVVMKGHSRNPDGSSVPPQEFVDDYQPDLDN
ncbi:MAG: hypothetical protein QGH15_08985 [Kiritimatiellia bacterium]|jgi:hypothetical protein|nr:hypothetical protein [Kiritimatiellia bacterium]